MLNNKTKQNRYCHDPVTDTKYDRIRCKIEGTYTHTQTHRSLPCTTFMLRNLLKKRLNGFSPAGHPTMAAL